VQARFISVEGADGPSLAAAITKATNTQNRINRQDLVALDLEQERLRQELAVEGITYLYKSGEAVIRNDSTFDLEEATLALACANPDLSLATQAKREIGRLWEDVTKPPLQVAFQRRDFEPRALAERQGNALDRPDAPGL
jgi:AIPR protein